MCVVSMVFDHYRPQFDRYPPHWPHDLHPVQPYQPDPMQTADWTFLAKLIKDFQSAKKAAETVDKLTAQPDCADPEKAKLEARVAELEKLVAGLMSLNAAKGAPEVRP